MEINRTLENLTPEQIEYIKKPTAGIWLGMIYPMASGLPKYFWLFLIPFYNIYLWFKFLFKGRQIAWEQGIDETFESYKKRQEMLSKHGKIMRIIIIIFFTFYIISFASLFFSGFSGGFGTDTAKTFTERMFTNQSVSELISPEYSAEQNYVDYEKDTRGDYVGSSFNNFVIENNISTVQGNIEFTNKKFPVCITMIKFGEVWKVNKLSAYCETE
jgi:hypothetical protein